MSRNSVRKLVSRWNLVSRRTAAAVLLFACAALHAAVTGSIRGQVTDAAGRAVPDATVTAQETDTGLRIQARTDRGGQYTLPSLPVGHYDLEVQARGFVLARRQGIVLDAGAELTLDTQLAPGGGQQTVTVTDDTLHIETASTQTGEVISGRQMTAVPLDGRSYTDLLALQPGVAPATALTSSTVDDVGATILNPSGTLNPGTLSVNGQRENANFYSVNGIDAEEDVNMGAAIVPNLDSIAEFRISTGSFDAEYGEFSGSQVTVVTRSGANRIHGSAFEFLRNTRLDARNYFSPTRGAFHQNQFGGTLGGPLRRDRVLYFADYQGTRQTQGIDTGAISVPSAADRSGLLSDVASSLTGSVSGPYLASLLSARLGATVTAGEPYFQPGCSSGCVFPGAVIPQRVWSTPATRLLGYIPAPNQSDGTFATSAFNQTLRDDKGALRLDAQTRFGLLTSYYFQDSFRLDNPYPTAQSGASVPGFNAVTTGRAQLASLGLTTLLDALTVNDLHLGLLRDATDLGQPVGGRNVTLAAQGFLNSDGTDSIVPLDPKGQGVENIDFNAYSIGRAANELLQTNNTIQAADTLTRVLGRHTLKLGGEFHDDQVNAHAVAQFNGNFVFNGTETGDDFADFLLGVPSQYNQSQLNPFYARNRYLGLFAQDAWQPLPELTINYGLRWDRIAPWSEKYNQISTFVAGQQSVVFPGAPAGILYPGDPGVPRTLSPVENTSFAPRLGLAWSPRSEPSGFLHGLLGGTGATSIRSSFGLFYSAIDALSISVLAANAPYGTTYSSPAPPLFATPFVSAADGTNYGQPFPYQLAALGASRSHPDNSVNWSAFVPVSGIPAYAVNNRTPYTEEWMLAIERQAGQHAVLSATYVGNASHRQRVLVEANPGNPSLCLSLSQPGEVASGTVPCGPYGENTVYQTPSGQLIDGTRGPLGASFGSNATQANTGFASYNALELGARYRSSALELFAAYTWSKSLDLSSNLGEEVNPFQPSLTYALSSFDVRQNFVLSYEYRLPFSRLGACGHLCRPLARNWTLSGITRLATGFPVTLINNGDNSLIGSNPNGVNNASIDEPDYNGAPLRLQHNPRSSCGNYFNTADFSMNALGTPGTAKRRFFSGPGADNWDMALYRSFALGQPTRSLQLRAEAFNAFNHTQFNGPTAVDGNIGSTTFGSVIAAAPPRILQLAARFSF